MVVAMIEDGSPPKIDYTTADDLLSRELYRLSLKDRNAIEEEVHGVSSLAPEESPQFLAAALHDLSIELDRVPVNMPYKAAFLKSQLLPNSYVNGMAFRLRFLRCDLFDAKKAAIRMMKFLSIASELFGPVALQRPLRFTDLNKEEKKMLRSGVIQVLPFRDRAGRRIFAWVDDFEFQLGTNINRTKITLFLHYAMTEDAETQRKGVVIIVWICSKKVMTIPAWEDAALMRRVVDGSPLRQSSNHFCCSNKPRFHVLRYVYLMVQGNERSRVRFHFGEDVELRYKLKCYGIPVELIPVTGTGNIKTSQWNKWIQTRKHLDKIRANGFDDSWIIDCPRSTDVVFRTGSSLTCHPGNSMFQSIIESKFQQHSAASQKEKFRITKEIINTVKQRGGRFLQWEVRGWWTELKGEPQIHTKVAISMRDFKSKLVAHRTPQMCSSSTTAFRNQDGKRRRIDGVDSECILNCGSIAKETTKYI